MPNARASTLIAENLAQLPHPDGQLRKLPGYSTTAKPEGLVKQITRGAQEIGDSIVNLIEQAGGQITFGDVEPAPAAASAPAAAEPRIAEIHCAFCNTRLLRINIANAPHLRINPENLAAMISSLTTDCDTGHGITP
jgi:hypothetical protein